jgi:hypothetical protein
MAVVVMDPAVWGHMDRVCEQLADHVGDEVHNDIAEAILPPMTGYGRGEMLGTLHGVPLGARHQIWIGTDHWMTVEYGAKPHIITPNGPWPLLDRLRGKYFGFLVHHPGSPEQAPMRKAIHQKRPLPYVGGM